MANTTWTWIGGTGVATIAANWTHTGPGNANGFPAAGDVSINRTGMVLLPLDTSLVANTLEIGGTAAAAGLTSTGDARIDFANPTFDAATVVTSAVPGNTTAETTVLDAFGVTVNQGTILADGPAGSTFTLAIAGTTVNGTFQPGYAYTSGLIQADTGNTLTITIGGTAELLNVGSVVADGGTVRIVASPSAIAGGLAEVRGFYVVEGGGTLEINTGYSQSVSGTLPRILFGDSTPGNTVKIDNIASDGVVVSDFMVGDTIDLGTSIAAVSTIVFDQSTSFLYLENNSGTILASLVTGGPEASGTFAIVDGTADGFVVGRGSDGDTILTTTTSPSITTGTSGTWQSATSWLNGNVPTSGSTALIGEGATAPFTLTTGSSPVTLIGFSLDSSLATLRVTSDTSAPQGNLNVYSGTLVVTSGNTLSAQALQSFEPDSAITIAAGATLALSGRVNPTLVPVNGVWLASVGNHFADTFSAGTVEIDGAMIAGPTSAAGGGGSTAIGYDSDGSASVIVNQGGTVTDTYTTVGSDPTSSGTLTLNGAGASWTDMIDASDPLNSRGYMVVGYNNVSSNTPAGLPAPAPIAAAQVLIENSATLTDQEAGYIADSSNSAGTVTVTSGGVWNIDVNGVGFLPVGDPGQGALNVLNGGTVLIGNVGTFMSNGTTFTAGGIGIGYSSAGGTVTVAGAGSQLITYGGMTVGHGGTGTLDVDNGGTVSFANYGLNIGNQTGGVGIVTVGGTGAAAALNFLPASGSIAAASGITFGNNAGTQGTLVVADNGAINLNGTGFVSVGGAAGTFGDIIVGGTTAAAVIDANVAGLTIGNSGTGVATVNSRGTISENGTLGIAIVLGQFSGSTGTLVVNGGLVTEGTAATGLTTGLDGGSGTLLVENQGTVSLAGAGMIIGSASGGSNSVTVQGSGSELKTSGTAGITVGQGGNGSLTVTSNGLVSDANSLTLGDYFGSNGSAAVAGGTLMAASLFDGESGNGALTINSGGTVLLTGAVASSIGDSYGGTGTVVVGGSGSGLLQGQTLIVGQTEQGALDVESGGSVSLAMLGLGGGIASAGGTGTLAVTGGGKVETGQLYIWQGSSITVDSSSAIDVGSSGNFVAGAIDIESGHTLAGNGIITTPIVDNGVIESLAVNGPSASNVSTGTLEIAGSLSGSGQLQIGAGSVLRLDSAPPVAEQIRFNGGGELILNAPGTTLANAIVNLSVGSEIDFNFSPGVFITNVQETSPGNITVFTNTGTYVLSNVSFAAGTEAEFYWSTNYNNGGSYQQITVAPDIYNWTGTSNSNIGNASNWQDQTNNQDPALNPPGADTQINFYNNPGILTGSATAEQANFGSGFYGTWTLQGVSLTLTGSANPPYGPFAVGFNTYVVITGGTLDAEGSTNIGNSNAGGVTVTAEGAAVVTTEGDSIGTNSGQTGALVVTGPNTTWTEQAGTDSGWLNIGWTPGGTQPGGVGMLTVSNGATLNTGNNSAIGWSQQDIGSANIESGGQWTVGTGGITVGWAGSGTLTANDGLILTLGFIEIGSQIGGVGLVSLSNGSKLTQTGSNGINVGDSGSGTLIANASTIVSPGFVDIAANIGGSGFVSLTGGMFGADGMNIGGSGAGTLTMSGGDVANSGGLAIGGNTGGSGTLTMSGGTFTNADYVNIAQGSDSEGFATLNGGLFTADGLTVGASGTGTLTVTGGTVTDSSGLTVGSGFNSLGIVSVSSGTISVAGDAIIGSNGSGTLTVGGGGTVLANGSFNAVGSNSGGIGELVINDGGTFVAASTSMDVGNSAGSSGELVVNAGGQLDFTLLQGGAYSVLQIGRGGATTTSPAATGSVLVTGTGALINTNQHAITVGDEGLGSLTVAQGGTVDTGSPDFNLSYSLALGNDGGDGAVTVTGAGSELNVVGDIIDGRGGTGSLTIEDDGTATITSTPADNGGVGIGNGPGSGPTATEIGGFGVATVTSGGVLDNQSNGGMTVGGNSDNGSLIVSNSGTVLAGTELVVGTAEQVSGTIYGGMGQVNIQPGGTVLVNDPSLTGYAVAIGTANSNVDGPTSTASGQVLVKGAGALLNANDGGISVGFLSEGNLTVSQGATVLTGSVNSSIYSALGIARQGDGSVTVSDAGSTLVANGDVYVGRAGSGSVTVENDGRVTIGLDGQGNGSISIGGAGYSSGTILYVGGSGTGLVTTGGDLFSTQSVVVGENGTDGTLTIDNGGTVEAGQNIVLGASTTVAANDTIVAAGASSTVVAAPTLESADGSINVGPGGLLKSAAPHVEGSPSVRVGDGTGSSGSINVTGGTLDTGGNGLAMGMFGNGNVVVGQGGTVLAGSQFASDAALDIGEYSTGTGALNVTGGTLVSTGGSVVIGDAGLGSINISGGGTVISNLASGDDAVIASTAGASGSSVNVSGTGSNWQISGTLLVGNAALGELSLTQGGSIGAAALDAGAQSGSSGNIVVSGPSTLLNVTGQFTVGDAGNADLALSAGATIDAGNFDIGLQAHASGVVDIEGTSTLNATGAVNVGDAGNAVLSLGADATVNSTSFNVGTAGVLVEFGDPINTGTLTNSSSIVVDGGFNSTTATARFVNNGLVVVENGGTENIVTPQVSGTGSMQISTNGDLVLNASSVAASQTITFQDATGTLAVVNVGGFQAVINSFSDGDKIVVDTTATAMFTLNGADEEVFVNGVKIATITFATTDLASAASQADAFSSQVVCFCKGTLIRTPKGEIHVETLRPGDRVVTLKGEARRILWIGTGRVMVARGRRSAATPVIVRKGALADNVPHHDLHVTKGHSFFIDGVLVPVEFLVNHRSILWDDWAQEVTIYHIELETHDVLLANGAPAESYRDDGNRWLFQNDNPGWHLPPQAPCAPVHTGGPLVDAIWLRLMDRSGPRRHLLLTDDPDLHLVVDGKRLDPIERGPDRYAFRLAKRPHNVRIVSRSAVPQELGIARDARSLGVAVKQMVLAQARRQRTLGADAACLTDGYHDFEPAHGIRWTDGDAGVPPVLFQGMDRAAMLILHLGGATQYLDEGTATRAA